MGFIRALINLVILLIILGFAYWFIVPYVATPDAPYWAKINSNMPDALRRFSCDQFRKNGAAAPIQSCEGF